MLRALELFGFKSFADRTRFDFHSGITGVVGPNGSGKSNVVDAIKWILGVQSAKSLRGQSMTDVIFNGAAGRKPSTMAEATLTFDNTSGFLRIDAPEVQIGRRIMLGGDAEYLINRSPARLKDIVKLFLGTGAGSTTYCIIEQGRVDQILQATASTRRKVFEEAAGISRYKADKAETEKKLARVDQNLLRLTDIVDEVRAQLDSLRGQATKAARYRDVSDRLREAWIGLAADDHRRLSAQRARIEDELAERAGRIAQAAGLQQSLEARLAGTDGEVSDVDDRLREAERRAAANREAIAGRQVAARHESERAADLDSEILRLQKQHSLMSSRLREAAAEHDRVRSQLQRCAADHDGHARARARREQRIAALTETIARTRAELATRRNGLLDRTRHVSALASRVSTLEAQAAAARESWQAAGRRRAVLEGEIAACGARVERCRGGCDEASAAVAAAQDALQGIRDRRAAVSGELDESQRGLAQQREQRTAWQARLAVLEDLESRKEGLGIGVREILSRAETSDYPPWNHIRGSVADLLDVDLEQAALIEVALGPRAQLIVLDDIRPLLEYLQSESCRISGRVAFVAYESDELRVTSDELREAKTGEPRHSSLVTRHFSVDLSGRPGVIDRADRLVSPPDELPRLAEQLLADTWIVDTLASAVALRAEVSGECIAHSGRRTAGDVESGELSGTDHDPLSTVHCPVRFVTLQGELLERDGTLSAGTVRSETALVSRKSELRRLKNELARLDRRIVEQERRLGDVEDSLGRVDEELSGAKSRLAEASERHAAAMNELAEVRRGLDRLEADWTSLAEEIARFDARMAQSDADFEQAQMDLLREDEELRAFQDRIAQAERELARDEQRLRALQERHAAEQLDLAKQEERLDGLRDADLRLEQESDQRGQQRDEAARRLDAALERRSRIRLRVLAAGAELAELFLACERLGDETRRLAAEKRAVRGRRTALLEEEAALRDDLRELHARQHDDEMGARDLRHHVAALERRIEEEFQVSLAEAVANGASAYAAYVERAGEDQRSEIRGQRSEVRGRRVEVGSSDAIVADAASVGVSTDAGSARFEDVRHELEADVERLRRQLKSMGSVDTDSLHDLDDLEDRYGTLAAQLDDLRHAKSELEEIVRKINGECRRRFGDTFAAIRGHFRELFRKLFGGGEGDIILEDADDPLECGIDIVARPPGKELRSISLLSGGERTMTAVALLMAIFKSNPSPFCVLDEVDAALDEANVDRFMNLLHEFRDTTQFIMITHRKPSMTVCDTLYGVTMEESGVSKRMSVRFEDIGENGEFRTSGRPSAAA
ncbi:MAG: AAA family ATPase [Planctomycetales bacterium]